MYKFRIFLYCVVLFMVVSCFCCCSEKKNEQGAYTTLTDLHEEEFYFIQSFIPMDERDKDLIKADNSDKVGVETKEQEVMFEHCLQVERKYNCRIVRQPSLGHSSGAAFAAAYAAGEQPADMICGNSLLLRDLYKSGILIDLNTIQAIDTDDEEKWGIKEQRVCTTQNGQLYAIPMAGSRYMPITREYFAAFACNMDVYNQFRLDYTPREMIEQGKWTFNGFYDLLLDVYDVDPENKIYGLALYNSIVTASVYANGGDFVVKERGRYVFGYTKPDAIKALEWAQKIYRTRGMIGEHTDFYAGKATFVLDTPNHLIHTSLKNVAWLPFPYGPDVEYGTTCVSYFGSYGDCTAILKHAQDSAHDQRTGIIFDALFEPTEFYGKDGYDKYMERNFFNSEEDYLVYKNNLDNMHYDWSKEFLRNDLLKDFSLACDTALGASGSFYPYIAPYEDIVNQIALAEIGKD